MVVLFVGLALGKTGPGMKDFLQVATPAGPFYKGSNRYGSVGFAKPPGPYEIGGGVRSTEPPAPFIKWEGSICPTIKSL